jgi:hypothetical protein
MDTEQPNASAEIGNQVSRANVFGMFLTLSLCLLAQPYGSFLYSRPLSRISTFAFFIWRLNPLACAAESVAILYVFLRSWLYISSLETPPLRVRKVVQLKVAALLLLRTDKRSPGGNRILDQLPRFQESNNLARTQLLTEVFSTNAFTIRELFITITTYVAMLTVIIKLAVSTLPWQISLWAWLLVFGWLVLQSLVVILQSSDLDDDDFKHIIRGIHLARQYLGTPVLEVILSAVSLPAFGYIGHFIYTWPQTVPQFVKWISAIPFFFAILIVWVFFPAIATLPLLAFDYLSQSQPWGRFVPNLYIMLGALIWFGVIQLIQLGVCLRWTGFDWLDKPITHVASLLFVAIMSGLLVWPSFTSCSEGDFLNCERRLYGVLISNLSVTAIVFGAVITCYDPAGTSRPGWADWLG